jgi:hypothetical protein
MRNEGTVKGGTGEWGNKGTVYVGKWGIGEQENCLCGEMRNEGMKKLFK